MVKDGVEFKVFLANVNFPITQLKLQHGAKIEKFSLEEGLDLFMKIENMSLIEFQSQFLARYPIFNKVQRSFYCINNALDKKDYFLGSLRTMEYLTPLITRLRLFKEGNIHLPIQYLFRPSGFIERRYSISAVRPLPKYDLESSEIPSLQQFIDDTTLPFQMPFLQLALDLFDLSYQPYDFKMGFLPIMMGLESVFQLGRHEIQFKISRGLAVLLGKDEDDSDRIFQEFKKLYGLRSDLVHKGKLEIINQADMLKARSYLRDSIKEIHRIGLEKVPLFKKLNSCGFGSRPWRHEPF